MLCLNCNVKLTCVETYTNKEVNYRRLRCPECHTNYYSEEVFIKESTGKYKLNEKRKHYRNTENSPQ